MSGKRALLTGGGGFIGRQAIAPLLAQGFAVHVAGRNPPALPDVTSHAADLLDPAVAGPLIAAVRPTHLLHLAWDVTPGRYWHAAENLDWVAASLRLYRAFAAAGGRRMVGAGTCAEYDWRHARLDEASTPLRPLTLYGVAKHALHQLLSAAAAVDGVSLAWGRVFFTYGPHEASERLVPAVIVPLLRGEAALVGDGRAERDFMHVADVAAALVALLDSEMEGAVNIATGCSQPVREVVLEIARQIGRMDLVRWGARATPRDEPPRLAATDTVLRSLGFRPRFTLSSGLADTIGWWADHRAHPALRHDELILQGDQLQQSRLRIVGGHDAVVGAAAIGTGA